MAMTCVGMLCVLLALATPPAARAQQGEDACHGASGDPTCHGAGADAAAVSLLQITAAIKTKTKEHQQVQEEAEQWVKAHNKYRCMHGIPYLTWNPTIAANSQAWGDQTGGGMQHSSDGYRENVAGFSHLGENLAWASPVAFTPAQAVKYWYSEIESTNGGRVSGFGEAGHYSQVVWKATTDVGCGTTAGLNVCEYGPAGNFGYADAYEANVNGPVKSEAECEGER